MNVLKLIPRLDSTSILFATAFLFSQSSAVGTLFTNGNFTDGSNVVTYNGTDDPWDHGSSNLIVGHTAEGNLFVFGGSKVINGTGTIAQNGGVMASATINGAGSEWTNTGTLSIGHAGEGTLNIQNGGKVTGFHGFIAASLGSTGTVTLTDGAQWIISDFVALANSSNTTATLNIESGSTVMNNQGRIGGSSSSSMATATVTGAGSKWINSNTLDVARRGIGILNVENGGVVTNTDSNLGQFTNANGTVTVDGTGSKWNNSDEVTLGFQGTGTLNVSNGGLVTSLRSNLADRTGSTGTATVSGAGSLWDNSSDFFVGGNSTEAGGTGTLNIQNNGSVKVGTTMKIWDTGTVNLMSGTLEVFRLDLTAPTATANFIMTGGRLTISNEVLGTLQQDGGMLAANSFSAVDITGDYVMNAGSNEFEIGGTFRGFQYDAFNVLGSAVLDGTMDINLISGFVPSLGDSFQLIEAIGGYSGTPMFDFSDATLGSGLVWDTSGFLSSGTIGISAVPEPSAFAFFALVAGVAGTATKWRSRKVDVVKNRT